MDAQKLLGMTKKEIVDAVSSLLEDPESLNGLDEDEALLFAAQEFYPELLDEIIEVIFAN